MAATVGKIDFLSPKQVANLIGKTENWLCMYGRGRRQGPPWYAIGGRIQYDPEDVTQWLKARRRT